MLILGRREGERCRLTVSGHLLKDGKPLVLDVELCEITGKRARLGFDAPLTVEIERVVYSGILYPRGKS